MDIRQINNYFGDMDLFLMDLILKGKIPEKGKILDVGCGEGRNGLYFIQHGYEYHGWDIDKSKLSLIEYLTKNLPNTNAHFLCQDIRSTLTHTAYDILLCSRVLHFAESLEDFMLMWSKLADLTSENGVIYVSMDSIIDISMGIKRPNSKVEFPDGATRFALTESIYDEIRKGFDEIEPLRTLVQHDTRAQSFFLLKKN